MAAYVAKICVSASFLILTGCGSTLPVMSVQYPEGNSFDTFLEVVAQHVRCELGRSVKAAVNNYPKRQRALKNWAAKLALTLKAVDGTIINPTLLASSLPNGFTFAASGQIKTDSTREMAMTYFLLFEELINEPDPGALDQHGDPLPCDKSGIRDPIADNLGIYQTLRSTLRSWDSMYVLSDRIVDGPYDTISHHVTFQIISSGSATPSWSFSNVVVNPAGQFLNSSRTSSDDLVITMGPTQLGSRKATKRQRTLSTATSDLDQSFFIDRLRGVLNRDFGR